METSSLCMRSLASHLGYKVAMDWLMIGKRDGIPSKTIMASWESMWGVTRSTVPRCWKFGKKRRMTRMVKVQGEGGGGGGNV